MNSPLQPELVQLETRYNELVDAVQTQAMSIDDAMRTLENLRVIDGEGLVWGMDAEGNFIAGAPGSDLSVTDPSRFRQQQLPARQDWQSPPTSFGAPAQNGLVEEEIEEDGTSSQTFNFQQYSSAPVAAPKRNLPKAKKPKGKPSLGSGIGATISNSGIGSWVSNNRRTVAVVLVALIALVVIILTQGGNNDAEASGIPTTSLSEMPTDTSGQSGQPSSVPAADPNAELPSGDQIATLTSALISGKRDLASGSMVNPGDAETIALNTAKFAGYSKTYNLPLTLGPVAAEEGGAVADVSVTDTVSKKVVLSGKIHFAKDGDHWYIKTWPELS